MQALEAVHFFLWDLLQFGQTGAVETEGVIFLFDSQLICCCCQCTQLNSGFRIEQGLESIESRVDTMCADRTC